MRPVYNKEKGCFQKTTTAFLIGCSVMFLVGFSIDSNEQITYDILKNNNLIGNFNVVKQNSGDRTTYLVNSEINVRFIGNFKAIGREKYVFQNDTLVFSTIYRRINNRVKTDQSMFFIGDRYVLHKKNKEETFLTGIVKKNLVTLFFYEPKNLESVFSDKYGKMVKVLQIKENAYRIDLPNGSHSIFYYNNGECIKIVSKGSFYEIELIPRFG